MTITKRFIDDHELTGAVDVGSGVRLLITCDPVRLGPYMVEHECKVLPGEVDPETGETGEDVQVVCAPALSSHAVTYDDELPQWDRHRSVTVEPSILCPDCGLHGWVRDGVWTDA